MRKFKIFLSVVILTSFLFCYVGFAESSNDVKRLTALAEQGDTKAQYELALKYFKGEGIQEDNKKFVYWIEKSAQGGFSEAQFMLGLFYYLSPEETADIFPKNYKLGLQWIEKAASQDNVEAQSYLGMAYEEGKGVLQDYEEAVYWYRKAAELGFSKAQYNMGMLYYLGQGVPQDYGEAAQWFEKAAEQAWDSEKYTSSYDPQVEAQIMLGKLYKEGYEDIPKNLTLAHMWLNLAASHGSQTAFDIRSKVEDVLTPAQIQEAQKLAREWVSNHPD